VALTACIFYRNILEYVVLSGKRFFSLCLTYVNNKSTRKEKKK